MSQIDELKQILLGDNSEKLSQLQERLENIDARTRDVAQVLAPAINQGIADNDDLIDALREPVSESLKQAIRVDPAEYANILYPAIAPSIRLAISQAISSLLVTINQTIESATTASGLGARFESIRTGVPYAELLLRRSLLYRVEHIYLIDRASGLLISDIAAADTHALDSDAVSAMFSAIQSFVQDSFSGNNEDRLTDFSVGEHKIWLAHAPGVMLACVLRGEAPESLKNQLYDVLDNIRTEYSQALSGFEGDNSEFIGVDDHMQPLLQLQLKEDHLISDAMDKEPTLVQRVVFIGLCGLALFFIFKWFDDRSRLNTVEHYFSQTPGLKLAKAHWADGKILIDGLMDPDAVLPFAVLRKYEIEPEDLVMQTTPFRSLEPKMELQRFAAELEPPAELNMQYSQNKVQLSGIAPISWLIKNDYRLRQLSADRRLDISALSASELSIHHYIDRHFRGSTSEVKNSVMSALVGKSWDNVELDTMRWGK